MYDQMVAHARRDHPDEACGIITGVDGRPARFLEMANAARSPTFYEFDSADLLRLYRDMDDRTRTPRPRPIPSRTDISYASEPGAHYVLVSHARGAWPDSAELRSYRIVDGVVTEEPVELTGIDRATWNGEVTCRRSLPKASTRSPATHRDTDDEANEGRRAWRSRSGSRPSCAPTPTARRRSRAPGDTPAELLTDLDARLRRAARTGWSPTTVRCTASSTCTSTTRTSGSSAA